MSGLNFLHTVLALAIVLCMYVVDASESWEHRNRLQELRHDWLAQGSPAEHQYIPTVHEFHRSEPYDAYANFLIGEVAYVKGDNALASRYFKFACETSSFMDMEYVRRFVQAQNLIDARDTVNVLSTAVQENIYREDLSAELAHWLRIVSNHSPQPLVPVLKTVHQLPTLHVLWVIYAEFALAAMQGPSFDVVEAAGITTYGLTIFPRSYELLLLSAALYVREGNVQCAGQHLNAARRSSKLSTDQFIDVEYVDRLTEVTANTHLEDTVVCGRRPPHHQISTYQTQYHAIANHVGLYWTDLSTHHMMPKFATPISESVSTFTMQHDGRTSDTHLPSLQVGCASPINCARPGFLIADAVEDISTHYVTMAYDLHMIESGSVGVVYSSHTLEHLSYNNPPVSCASFPVSYRNGEDRGCYSELDAALAEWRRVLATGGTLLVSVPDFTVLAQYFLNANSREKLFLRGFIYGGQSDQFDFHKNAFFFEYMRDLLLSHQFCNVTRVGKFGMFKDASEMVMRDGELLSVNVRAIAC